MATTTNPIIQRALREGFRSGGMIGDIYGGIPSKYSVVSGGPSKVPRGARWVKGVGVVAETDYRDYVAGRAGPGNPIWEAATFASSASVTILPFTAGMP